MPMETWEPHPVRCLRTSNDMEPCRFVGPLCMSRDVIRESPSAPSDLRPGDAIAIGNVGAYDISGGFPWIRTHAGLLLLDGDSATAVPLPLASVWRPAWLPRAGTR